MSESVLSVLLLLLSCAVLLLIVQDTAAQPPLSQLYVDDDAWDALMEGREAYDGAVSVRFNEYELFRDHETGLLLYSLIIPKHTIRWCRQTCISSVRASPCAAMS